MEGLLGMFVGIFKKIFRVLKEGIKVFMEAWPILFGKESKNMTSAQKGDAIIKILGGSAVALCGIGIDMLLDKLSFIPEWLRGPIATLLTGLASALMFYALDKADLFNVKADRRNQRINEIFDERIKDIETNTRNFERAATEALRKQMVQYNNIMENLKNSIATGNMSKIGNECIILAGFLGTELGYTNLEEFDKKRKNNNLNWNF